MRDFELKLKLKRLEVKKIEKLESLAARIGIVAGILLFILSLLIVLLRGEL